LGAQRGKLGGVRQFLLGHAPQWFELSSLTVAEGDGAGLVEQKRIDIARGGRAATALKVEQKLRQLRHIDRNPPRLVAREQLRAAERRPGSSSE
jgi:hypothetical protein